MRTSLAEIALPAAFGLLLTGAAAAAPAADPIEPVAARLVTETAAIAPGQTVWVDLHLDIAPGWHTYWRNPGDSGLPTEISWKLPAGFAAGELLWPVPERFVQGGIGGYGYAGSTDLLVPLTAPAQMAAVGTAPIQADASWLVCSDICIPGAAKLRLDLPIAAAAARPDPTSAPLFAAARRHLPQPARFAADFAAEDGQLRVRVPSEALAGVDRPTVSFFPADPNVVDAAAEPQQRNSGDATELVLKRATGPAAVLPERLSGVLEVRPAKGEPRAYALAGPISTAPVPAGSVAPAWWQALLLAFVGGMILNLMPCVFPVLSLKLLGLATSVHRADERRHGIAYAAGVIASFALLGGVLLVLRGGGTVVGWGFQLQSPIVVGLLAYLLFAMGLSLSGVAEFGAGIAGVGGRFAERAGLAGAFATGVLATIVATPCTAPFMGAALGFAVIAPAPLALVTMVTVGAGLAAPVVLATAVPGLARLLPRPGPWMLWFKQLLAFPLYGTVAWLVWVLLQEVRPDSALFALFGLVLVGFAVWIYGRTRAAAASPRHAGTGIAAAGLAAALALTAMLTPAGTEHGAALAAADGLGYQPFSTARLAQLEAEHQPVFVNLTAAWCITCLVNERTALDSAAVRRAFAGRRIVALKGDWTRQDPEITGYLQKFGRSGVPLYLLYDRTGKATMLPQLLTEAAVLAAVEKI